MINGIIKGATIITATGEQQLDIEVSEGVINGIEENYDQEGSEILNAHGKILMPTLIDCHVHFREPGLTHKATMASESKAAKAGGVTTVCEMPNTNPPTVSIEALTDKVVRAAKIQDCDIRFFFGITKKEHLIELRKLWEQDEGDNEFIRSRCSGVKLFLENSTGNQRVEGGAIEEAFRTCGELRIPIVAHCEDPEINTKAANECAREDVAAHSIMRPSKSEAVSINYAIGLAKKHGTQFHVAHLSTAEGLEVVRQAKADGLPVTCEATPHHLFLSTEDYEELGTFGKMNPPLRSPRHREALWQGIKDGIIDCIASDHAPHKIEEKQSPNPLDAPSGIPGTETMIPLLLSVAAGNWPHPRAGNIACKLSYSDIVRLCYENPNKIYALNKPGISKGAPLECVLIDSADDWVIKADKLNSACGWTAYEGWQVTGSIKVLTADQ